MRCASLITIRSGFITSRIEAVLAVAEDLVHRDQVADQPLDVGEHVRARQRDVEEVRASGRAAPTSRRSQGNTFSSHQRAMSGNDEQPQRLAGRRAVDDDHVELARLVVALDLQQAEELVHARRHGQLLGRDVHRRRGRRAAAPSQSCTAPQLASISRWACTSWPQRRSPTGVGSGPSSASSESERLWAGSVERTTVRSPAARAAARGRGGDARLADAALARVEDRPRRRHRPPREDGSERRRYRSGAFRRSATLPRPVHPDSRRHPLDPDPNLSPLVCALALPIPAVDRRLWRRRDRERGPADGPRPDLQQRHAGRRAATSR